MALGSRDVPPRSWPHLTPLRSRPMKDLHRRRARGALASHGRAGWGGAGRRRSAGGSGAASPSKCPRRPARGTQTQRHSQREHRRRLRRSDAASPFAGSLGE
eukprot:scaffold285_cov304-Pinguiococcus_pyrenoidosus.AAC.12